MCNTTTRDHVKLSIDFTSHQREFLGLLTFGFQLVKTNVTEKTVKIPALNIVCHQK